MINYHWSCLREFPCIFCVQKLGRASSSLDEGQQRIVASLLRASRNGGVGLEGKDKEKFNEIKLRLAELSTKFRYFFLVNKGLPLTSKFVN